ncbi:MAG: carboxypeptidase-like regulatory domain-containing protein [Prevotella sp.]|nr:carboxypeptidase-like regulatory domain-containing protein [Prevotella sp.]
MKQRSIIKHILVLLAMMLAAVTPSEAATSRGVAVTQQQRQQVSGTVVDEQGEPLIGATVTVKGTSVGVATDTHGHFALQTSAQHPVLTVSYIGYETQEVTVGNRTHVDIRLQPAAGHQIQEVVVTAMGILRKEKSLTYATQQVKAEDLMKVQDVNVANTLEGKIAGVTITPNAGGAGGASKIQLRGAKSIMGASAPLIVVDGIPLTNETRGQITDANNMTETAFHIKNAEL